MRGMKENFLGTLYSGKRINFKILNDRFKEASAGDFIINIVQRRKNKQKIMYENIFKIIKIDLSDWIYYKIVKKEKQDE